MYDQESTEEDRAYEVERVPEGLVTQDRKDRSPVQIELDTIDKALSSLMQKTEVLASRVAKVLVQPEPRAESGEAKDVEPVGSNLTLELKTIKNRIYRIERTISDVSDRVEL